eukprot:XP_001704521.1 Hypothetical protein GL50803_12145 [Giardia lamblia ATCC 50803]
MLEKFINKLAHPSSILPPSVCSVVIIVVITSERQQ